MEDGMGMTKEDDVDDKEVVLEGEDDEGEETATRRRTEQW